MWEITPNGAPPLDVLEMKMDQLVVKRKRYKEDELLEFICSSSLIDGHLCNLYPEEGIKNLPMDEKPCIVWTWLFRLANGIKEFTPMNLIYSEHKKSGQIKFYSRTNRKKENIVMVEAHDPVTGDGGGIFIISRANYDEVMKGLEPAGSGQPM